MVFGLCSCDTIIPMEIIRFLFQFFFPTWLSAAFAVVALAGGVWVLKRQSRRLEQAELRRFEREQWELGFIEKE